MAVEAAPDCTIGNAMTQDRALSESTASPSEYRGNWEVYVEALRHLPLGYRDRLNVAAVASFLAAYGRNIAKIARLMERDRRWVRVRIAAAERLFKPALDAYGLHDDDRADW
jgi:hypothetical protein